MTRLLGAAGAILGGLVLVVGASRLPLPGNWEPQVALGIVEIGLGIVLASVVALFIDRGRIKGVRHWELLRDECTKTINSIARTEELASKGSRAGDILPELRLVGMSVERLKKLVTLTGHECTFDTISSHFCMLQDIVGAGNTEEKLTPALRADLETRTHYLRVALAELQVAFGEKSD